MKHTETEIKFRLPDVVLAGAIVSDALLLELGSPGKWQAILVEAHYYDTVDLDLNKWGIAYRVRKEGEKIVATVKKGGNFQAHLQQRQEWNREVDSLLPDVAPFFDTEIGCELEHITGDKRFKELFLCCFERKLITLFPEKDTQVELAIDTGEIVSGESSEAICEVELELKTGEINVMLQLADQLAPKYGLLPEPRSKYSRGLALTNLSRQG